MEEHPTKSDERAEALDELMHRQEIEREQYVVQMLVFIAGLSLLLVGMFFWLQSELVAQFFTYDNFDPNRRDHQDVLTNVKIFSGFFILISSVCFAFLYMVGFNPKKQREKSFKGSDGSGISSDDNVAIVGLLKSINESLEKGKLESTLSESERNQILDNISHTVKVELNGTLLKNIEDTYGQQIHNDKLANYFEQAMSPTIARLRTYAVDLQSKASVNLAYGIGATITAIFILIFVLFSATAPETSNQIELVFFYTSRLFLVFLVQGISIFFLNLYKSTLRSILYINNEITNHESKRDSISVALRHGDREALKSMLTTLSNTERNFIVRKGETSIYESNFRNAESNKTNNLIARLISELNSTKNT